MKWKCLGFCCVKLKIFHECDVVISWALTSFICLPINPSYLNLSLYHNGHSFQAITDHIKLLDKMDEKIIPPTKPTRTTKTQPEEVPPTNKVPAASPKKSKKKMLRLPKRFFNRTAKPQSQKSLLAC